MELCGLAVLLVASVVTCSEQQVNFGSADANDVLRNCPAAEGIWIPEAQWVDPELCEAESKCDSTAWKGLSDLKVTAAELWECGPKATIEGRFRTCGSGRKSTIEFECNDVGMAKSVKNQINLLLSCRSKVSMICAELFEEMLEQQKLDIDTAEERRSESAALLPTGNQAEKAKVAAEQAAKVKAKAGADADVAEKAKQALEATESAEKARQQAEERQQKLDIDKAEAKALAETCFKEDIGIQEGVCHRSEKSMEISTGSDLIPLGYGAKKEKTNTLLANQCDSNHCSCASGESYCSTNRTTGIPIWVHQRYCTGLIFKTSELPIDADGTVVKTGTAVLQRTVRNFARTFISVFMSCRIEPTAKELAIIVNSVIAMLKIVVPPLVALNVPYGTQLEAWMKRLANIKSDELIELFFGWYLKKNGIKLEKCRDTMSLVGSFFEDKHGNTFFPQIKITNMINATSTDLPSIKMLNIKNTASRVCCTKGDCVSFQAQASKCTAAMAIDMNNILKDHFDIPTTMQCFKKDLRRWSAKIKTVATDALNAAKEQMVKVAAMAKEKIEKAAETTAKATEKKAKEVERGAKADTERAAKVTERAAKAARERTVKEVESAAKATERAAKMAVEKGSKVFTTRRRRRRWVEAQDVLQNA